MNTPWAEEWTGNPGGGYMGLWGSVFGCGDEPGDEFGELGCLEIGDSACLLSLSIAAWTEIMECPL